VYADDSEIVVQENTFEVIKVKLFKMLETLGNYYKVNHLMSNPSKTNMCGCHLRNKQANKKLRATWESKKLTRCITLSYLGMTLDRSPTYKTHCKKPVKKNYYP